MKTVLKMENITKEFVEPRKNILALNKINFELNEGQCIGLLGPSGSGKTTLLQIAALLDNPTAGEITINNQMCSSINEEKRNLLRKKNIGFIYQNFFLLDSFSALENIIIPQLINGSSYSLAKKRSVSLLSSLGLLKRMHNRPKELSGGEKQRVAILRAISNMPKIVLADEPTGNLDKQNSENVIKIIKKLVKEFNISFVIATHNLSMVKNFDKIVKLSEGKIV
ncbi:MAG: ABC transporter [Pelagibacteraceae bacterium]|nr:ABC transporter [Pelagibacteraceae bacterium]